MENETSKVEEISKNHQIFAKFCPKYHGKAPKCVQNVKKSVYQSWKGSRRATDLIFWHHTLETTSDSQNSKNYKNIVFFIFFHDLLCRGSLKNHGFSTFLACFLLTPQNEISEKILKKKDFSKFLNFGYQKLFQVCVAKKSVS